MPPNVPWNSCGAPNLVVPSTEMSLLCEVWKKAGPPRLHLVTGAWQGAMVIATHLIVIHSVDDPADNTSWHFALTHVMHRLVWCGQRNVLPWLTARLCISSLTCMLPVRCLSPLSDLTLFVGHTCQWTSPAWQHHTFSFVTWPFTAARTSPASPTYSLLELLARNACLSMQATWTIRWAKAWGIAVVTGEALMGTLWKCAWGGCAIP